MTYPYSHRTERISGPASRVLYDSGVRLRDPNMACRPGLRLEISKAVSHLYFLHPHAIILSHIESRPLADYYSHKSYEDARYLYFGGSSPGADLQNCLQAVYALRQ
jgi:hypothetical protein